MGTVSSSLLALVAATSLAPSTHEIATDVVDLVEVNHYYDEKGLPILQQLIFYDWCSTSGRYQVCAFRIIRSVQQMPYRMQSNGLYVVVWHDDTDGVLRKVYARSLRQTWTQHDPEMLERDRLPKEHRRELTRAVKPPAVREPVAEAPDTRGGRPQRR